MPPHAREWKVVRRGKPAVRGQPNNAGPFTHREARKKAMAWFRAGWDVVLRRKRDGETHEVRPKFPGVKRG